MPLMTGRTSGQATPDAWNDVKLYYKKSLGSDGQFRVYLNGVKVFERANQKNMIGRRDDGSGGYVKFGMYTEISSEFARGILRCCQHVDFPA